MAPLIIYEDEDIVAVNKPALLSVHRDGKSEEETLADWFVQRCPEAEHVGGPLVLNDGRSIARPGIVHRIDKETSGVLVLAKHQDAYLHLKSQFQNRRVNKTYNAFAYGVIRQDTGVIDARIGRSRRDFRLRAVEGAAYGTLREAVTYFQVIERGKEATYVEVYPQTGRTHQIRVHFKSIGHPVVCDKLYAPARVRAGGRTGGPKRPCILGFKRLALHACALSFVAPSGERLVLEAPLPEDFERALKELS